MKDTIISTLKDVGYSGKYLEKYINLIDKESLDKHIKFKTHKHHIIPQHQFRLDNTLDKSLMSNSTNLVYLLVVDHALAHYYLYKAAKVHKLKYYNLMSYFKILTCFNSKIETKDLIKNKKELVDEYEKLKIELSKETSINHHPCQRGKNSKAKKNYLWNEKGELIKVYGCSKDLIEDLNLSSSGEYLFELLRTNPLVICKGKILSRQPIFNREYYIKCLENKEKAELDGYITDIYTGKLRRHRKIKCDVILTCSVCKKEIKRTLYYDKLQLIKAGKVVVKCPRCSHFGVWNKGQNFTEEHKQRISNKAKGRKWYYNPKTLQGRQLHPGKELDNLVKEGWIKGQPPHQKQRIINNKG